MERETFHGQSERKALIQLGQSSQGNSGSWAKERRDAREGGFGNNRGGDLTFRGQWTQLRSYWSHCIRAFHHVTFLDPELNLPQFLYPLIQLPVRVNISWE